MREIFIQIICIIMNSTKSEREEKTSVTFVPHSENVFPLCYEHQLE